MHLLPTQILIDHMIQSSISIDDNHSCTEKLHGSHDPPKDPSIAVYGSIPLDDIETITIIHGHDGIIQNSMMDHMIQHLTSSFTCTYAFSMGDGVHNPH